MADSAVAVDLMVAAVVATVAAVTLPVVEATVADTVVAVVVLATARTESRRDRERTLVFLAFELWLFRFDVWQTRLRQGSLSGSGGACTIVISMREHGEIDVQVTEQGDILL